MKSHAIQGTFFFLMFFHTCIIIFHLSPKLNLLLKLFVQDVFKSSLVIFVSFQSVDGATLWSKDDQVRETSGFKKQYLIEKWGIFFHCFLLLFATGI